MCHNALIHLSLHSFFQDREIADLQRQIAVYKQDLKKAREDFNNSLRQANQQLEESQQHCQKLASSGKLLFCLVTILCTKTSQCRRANQ